MTMVIKDSEFIPPGRWMRFRRGRVLHFSSVALHGLGYRVAECGAKGIETAWDVTGRGRCVKCAAILARYAASEVDRD